MALNTVSASGPLEVGQITGVSGAKTFVSTDSLSVPATFTVSLSSAITQANVSIAATGNLVLCPGASLTATSLSGTITHSPRMIVTTAQFPTSTSTATTSAGVFTNAGN